MKDSQRETIKKWINTWQKASSSLNKIKSNELQSDNYYRKNLTLVHAILYYAFDHRLSDSVAD